MNLNLVKKILYDGCLEKILFADSFGGQSRGFLWGGEGEGEDEDEGCGLELREWGAGKVERGKGKGGREGSEDSPCQ